MHEEDFDVVEETNDSNTDGWDTPSFFGESNENNFNFGNEDNSNDDFNFGDTLSDTSEDAFNYDDSDDSASDEWAEPSEEQDEAEQEEYVRGSAVAQMSDEMKAEYDSAFTGEERTNNLLKLSTDKFTRERKKIKILEIGYPEYIKKGRYKTVTGLTASIKELGVLTPIHVMTTECGEDDDEGMKYILIDGMRRIFGSMKNSIQEIEAIVWDFKDKDFGADIALPLGLMLNRQQKRQWSEIWDLYQILELQSAITPATLEYLLQMESGDAMKLKDVMLCKYSEVKESLLNGEKSLEACYKMLAKLRKEEDQLAEDDVTGFSDTVETAEEFKGESEAGSDGQLSDQDVMELLEMVDSIDEEVTEEDFDEMNRQADGFAEQQKVGDRHPLDPALRQAVLARDDFTCKCCDMRMIGARLGLIAVHHVIPVHSSGKDVLENLVTLCLNCHVSLHVMERNGGSIVMDKRDFDKLSKNEQDSLKRALKLARIAIEADKRKGMSREKVAEATQSSVRHIMPGQGMQENRDAYNRVMSNRSEN